MVDHQVTRRVELRVVGRQGLEPCTRGLKDVRTTIPSNVRAAQTAVFNAPCPAVRHADYAGLCWALPPECHQGGPRISGFEGTREGGGVILRYCSVLVANQQKPVRMANPGVAEDTWGRPAANRAGTWWLGGEAGASSSSANESRASLLRLQC
jgi:hypothetical protein